MDYQEYKHDFLESLRNDSAISGSETEEEFLNRALGILTDFNEIEDPMCVGMGDKSRKNKSLCAQMDTVLTKQIAALFCLLVIFRIHI